MSNTELAQTMTQRHAVASRDHSSLVAKLRPHAQRRAIAHMKTLGFVTRVIHEDPAVGEDAVHIKHEQCDAFYSHEASVAAA